MPSEPPPLPQRTSPSIPSLSGSRAKTKRSEITFLLFFSFTSPSDEFSLFCLMVPASPAENDLNRRNPGVRPTVAVHLRSSQGDGGMKRSSSFLPFCLCFQHSIFCRVQTDRSKSVSQWNRAVSDLICSLCICSPSCQVINLFSSPAFCPSHSFLTHKVYVTLAKLRYDSYLLRLRK